MAARCLVAQAAQGRGGPKLQAKGTAVPLTNIHKALPDPGNRVDGGLSRAFTLARDQPLILRPLTLGTKSEISAERASSPATICMVVSRP